MSPGTQIKRGLLYSHLRGPLPARPYRARLCCPQHWPRTGPGPAAQPPRLCTLPAAYGQAACLPRADPPCAGAAAIPAVQRPTVSLKASRGSLHACYPHAARPSMLSLQPVVLCWGQAVFRQAAALFAGYTSQSGRPTPASKARDWKSTSCCCWGDAPVGCTASSVGSAAGSITVVVAAEALELVGLSACRQGRSQPLRSAPARGSCRCMQG